MVEITKAEYLASWLHPLDAVQCLTHMDASQARIQIQARVHASRVKIIAEEVIRSSAHGNRTILRYWVIPNDVWPSSIANAAFWSGGDVAFYEDPYNYICTGVRFDRAGIEAMVYRPAQQAPVVVAFEVEAPRSNGDLVTAREADGVSAPDQGGPAVPDAKLARWHELYVELYPKAGQNEASALAHAKATFPGNTVSRARVRKLRGDQPLGRKAKAAT